MPLGPSRRTLPETETEVEIPIRYVISALVIRQKYGIRTIPYQD